MRFLSSFLVAVATIAGILICKSSPWLQVAAVPVDFLRRLWTTIRHPMAALALVFGVSNAHAADYWVQVVDHASGYMGGENIVASMWINRGTLLRVGDVVVFTEEMQIFSAGSGTVVETWATGSFSVDCVRLVRTTNAITHVDARVRGDDGIYRHDDIFTLAARNQILQESAAPLYLHVLGDDNAWACGA